MDNRNLSDTLDDLSKILLNAGLLGPDKGVALDLEKSKQCPFCNFHLEKVDLAIMSIHMSVNHQDRMTDEDVNNELKRIRNEQDSFLS